MEKDNHIPDRNKSIKILKIIAVIILACFLIFAVDYIYVKNLPTGRFYHYTYTINIENVSANYSIIVPVVILENGSLLGQMDFQNTSAGNFNFVSTPYGIGLEITGNKSIYIEISGELDASENSTDYIYDGFPILSMSDFNHSYYNDDDEIYYVWIYSSIDGIEFSVSFESWWKDWKINDGIITSGYVRGGGGYYLSTWNNSISGWNQYTAEVGIVCVE